MVWHTIHLPGRVCLRRAGVRGALIVLLLTGLAGTARAGRVVVRLPSPLARDAVALGQMDFGPGELLDSRFVRLTAEPGGREVPLAVLEQRTWPDGSVLSVRLAFRALPGVQYWLEWNEAARTLDFQHVSVPGVPEVVFELGLSPEGGEATLDVPVGELTVRLDRNPGLFYYWYVVPIAAILAALIYRKTRLK